MLARTRSFGIDTWIVFSFHLHLVEKPWRRWIKQLAFSTTDILHCSSAELVEQVRRDFHQPAAKIAHICLGVDQRKYFRVTREERAAFRQSLNLAEEDFVLIFAGRLDPEKNAGLLVEELRDLQNHHPEVKLLLAGDGACRKQLEAKVTEYALGDSVRFLGYQPEMRVFYGAADLLILPSHREAFGLVVVEAACCGLPCLRSDTFGARDQIVPGVNGHIFSNERPGHFHKQLLACLESRQQVRTMGVAAHDLAMGKFTLEIMGQRFDSLYRRLLS